jgi:Domain of unknown function (DUF4386)
MSQAKRNPIISGRNPDLAWNGLYRIAGVAALMTTALFLIDIFLLTGAIPKIHSAAEWLALMQQNRLTGILELYFTDLFGLLLVIPLFFALYGALRATNRVYAALAAAVGLAGIGILFASNSNYSLVSLSDQYAAATTEVLRTQILDAAQTLYATLESSTGFLMASFLIEGSLLLLSVLMLRSGTLGKAAGWIGIGAHGLDFLRVIASLVLVLVSGPALAGAVGTPLLAVGGTLQLVWYPLVAVRLIRLASSDVRKAGEAEVR